ncbi:SAR2788 family putative toxin [Salipaludibacillus sp. LMS25]|nr:SAR2788 family putative toxin [Salipaludibacillus sp. LMS25]
MLPQGKAFAQDSNENIIDNGMGEELLYYEVETDEYIKDDIGVFEASVDTGEISIDSELLYNIEDDDIVASAVLVDEKGEELYFDYEINIIDIDLNTYEFIAEFIDVKTKEVSIYNSSELSASALPLVGVVIGFLAKQTLKKAISKFGPKAIITLMKTSEKLAGTIAKKLGYKATNYKSQGAKIYERTSGKGLKFIVRDKTSHNGGVWKGASKRSDLGSWQTRSGTYNLELKRIGD